MRKSPAHAIILSIEAIAAERVLVAREVLAEQRLHARLQAMLARIDTARVDIVTHDVVEASLRGLGPRETLARQGFARHGRRKELVAFALWGADDVFPGYSWRELRNARRERARGVLCQTGVEIQSAVGCAYDCTYCPYGSFLCVRVDVETFVERVAALAVERRSQQLFKLNNRTDTLALEPEYGLVRAMVERFASLDGKYLLLNAKGCTVDSLLDLDHRKKTVVSLTLNPTPVAALLEASAPPPEARLGALRRMAQAGYPIRVRFSPIVPLRGWREAYRDLIRQLARVAKPELVTLWTLAMVDFDELSRIVPLEALDPAVLECVSAAASSMRGIKGAPFPPELRIAIYREISTFVRESLPDTQVALCLETPEVWSALAPLVSPSCSRGFDCNCGPRTIPGLRPARRE